MASNESSWEIEKFFNQQLRDQKRTGRGVHYRKGKGSDKAGVAGGVKYVKHNFKKYEKNSKTKTSNLYENVMPFNEFKKWDEDDKIALLIQWLIRYSKSHIAREMGIHINKLYTLIDQYNIEEIIREMDYTMTPEELQQAKENPVEPHVFKQLPNEQKYVLVEYYLKDLKLPKEQVAEIMGGINPKSVASTKTRFKKDYDKLSDHEKAVLNGDAIEDNQPEDNETQEQHDEDDLFLIGNTLKNPNNKQEHKQVEEDDNKEEVEEVQTETPPKQPKANETYGLQLTLPSGEYNGIDVKQKLEGLKVLVNEHREYTVEIVLKEKK